MTLCLHRHIDILMVHIYVFRMISTFVANVSFERHTYSVNETDGKVETALVLSNPSSTVVTVGVFTTSGSATGKNYYRTNW